MNTLNSNPSCHPTHGLSLHRPLQIATCLLLLVSGLSAQIVFGEPVSKKDGPTSRPAAKTETATKASTQDAAMDSWIQLLASRIGDQNPGIRKSAGAALTNIGKASLPTLQKIAASGEGRAASEATNLIARIKRGRPERGQEGGRRGPRRNNMGRKERMAKNLKEAGLKEADQKRVFDRYDQMRTIFRQLSDGELTQEEGRAAMKEARDDIKNILMSSLGKEGYEKYLKASRSGRPSRRGGRRGPPPSEPRANGDG